MNFEEYKTTAEITDRVSPESEWRQLTESNTYINEEGNIAAYIKMRHTMIVPSNQFENSCMYVCNETGVQYSCYYISSGMYKLVGYQSYNLGEVIKDTPRSSYTYMGSIYTEEERYE